MPNGSAPPRRVLVTGFNDWRNLEPEGNIWYCNENPSCRLLTGSTTSAQPTNLSGPLVAQLKTRFPNIEWVFRTLPTTWGAFEEIRPLYANLDAAVHTGLGVYDAFDKIFIENGAYGFRGSITDAAGELPGEADGERGVPIGSGNIALNPQDPIAMGIRRVANRKFGGFRVETMQSRDSNNYICNETNHLALQEVMQRRQASKTGAQTAFFLHLPYPKSGDSGYKPLASAVAQVIGALVVPGQ